MRNGGDAPRSNLKRFELERNRQSRAHTRQCSTMLQHLLPAIILVIADHGADEDWGETCYPPHAKQS